MANLNLAVCSMMITTLAFTLFTTCDANNNKDDNPKLHIVYMGSLPETTNSYSPTSHHLNLLQRVLDGSSNPANSLVRSYKRSFNGFAAMLTNEQVAKLAEMEDVVSVFPSMTFQTQTTRSWDFLGFPKAVKRQPKSIESNLVVGVLDSGIWPESESFNDKVTGPVPEKWKGTCAGGKNFTCNKKLIGARFYVDDSARDGQGHGSHTASIAAGNYVDNVGFFGIAQGTARGAVPSARIAAYRICNAQGCAGAGILAAFDDAIDDGVDIISISVGTSFALPLAEDPIAIGAFHAMAKGILVSQSAGNNGPITASVSSIAPWLITVAANTIDRQIIDKVVLGNGNVLTGSSINTFKSNGMNIPIALINGNSTNCMDEFADQCKCLDKKLVEGKIVLCDTYNTGVPKDSGAAGAVVNEDTGNVGYVTLMPFVALPPKDYELIKSYRNSTKDPRAEILKSESARDRNAPKVATFSGRGPNSYISEILKPDVSAPGVDILAAYSPISTPTEDLVNDNRSVSYSILSGTSMSCPHVSGIATYVKSFHPDWSPAAIKSAILTSATPMVRSSVHDVGEYAYGSGQANPVQALNPGLVYDINKGDYVQMLCNSGYDNATVKLISGEVNPCKGAADRSLVRNLNYPTFAARVLPNVTFNISFGRTVTNVGLANSTYKVTITPNPEVKITVTPTILSFKALNENKWFVVNVSGKVPRKSVVISSIVWSDGTHNVRSPIVIDVSSGDQE
ncbi:hypothetical protein PIB30_061541 [Stylosanthes scabra]|uniref:Cucumisin n=1 Tax=Stylosanthes scabra TaxID=79078 RepID=A0ABU6QLG6_9FABA|nr:hypothetical protein [Stylosanthes scabra]